MNNIQPRVLAYDAILRRKIQADGFSFFEVPTCEIVPVGSRLVHIKRRIFLEERFHLVIRVFVDACYYTVG